MRSVRRVDAKEQSLSIVFLGSFNPAIVHPSWFGASELLTPAEVEDATVEVVHAEVAQFTSDWLTVSCTRSRFALATSHTSHFEPLRDLAVATLSLLSHTPVTQLGVNHDCVLVFPSRDAFDELGWTLAPKDNWSPLNRPGLAMLVEQGERTDSFQGYVRVHVEPRLDGPFEAAIKVNDHYDFRRAGTIDSAEPATATIRDEWENIERRALEIVDNVRQVASKAT